MNDMNDKKVRSEVVFATPWFDLTAKAIAGEKTPHYVIQTADYVGVLAITSDSNVLLVRQYRPAVDAYTLELPSGHVDPGETPEQSARRELLEETGYEATRLSQLGVLRPDAGRLGNRMWCFFAPEVRRCGVITTQEQTLQVFESPLESFLELVVDGRFSNAPNIAVLTLALARGALNAAGSGPPLLMVSSTFGLDSCFNFKE